MSKHIEALTQLSNLSEPIRFGTAGEAIRHLVPVAILLDERLAALEAASKPANNEDLKRALIDAQNAIEKALNHFRTTAEENRCGK
ncbi:hypothetical protein [Agrobacterium larrymoorei]|uniref:Uncharacterized protein n=1 Tax=Agrobacterium larrymoorei TaxID=160699 RepID=A0ABU0UDZ7_9HYPH|nr:hypothetical protein [Agrobacterium larrymoorei]MDQ1183163.1 hypothetical protein [Agrobacterium larrymoorei]